MNEIKNYRSTSLWFHWSDAIYPDKGIEAQILTKAKKCREAGINLVIIFGFHFRWDYIYIWDRVHELFKFTCETFHKQGIQVFDHHSANLTHRPRDIQGKWDIYEKNRHHVPFYPSASAASELTFNGTKLNDFRMIDVVSGEPCYLPNYTAEIFCMNNELFRGGYKNYLKKLFSQTGIDGLMCDDIIYYPQWHGCACQYCKNKFKTHYGHALPPSGDDSFWGNYESPVFRDWVRMRYQDSGDFLAMVRDEIGSEVPLLSCCSSSVCKAVDAGALNAGILAEAGNHIMLEMCGDIVGLDGGFYHRLPDILYNQGISQRKKIPSLGLGYAFYPDTAFFVWALDKLMGASTWVSTLKGRLGIPEENLGHLPDEWDIVGEGFNFEKKYQKLFTANPDNRIAVYFSFDTKTMYGDSEVHYAGRFSQVVQYFFRKNAGFDVVDVVPAPDKYPFLVLCNAVCLSSATRAQLNSYVQNGGTIIAGGACGLRDGKGNDTARQWLEEFGVKVSLKEPKAKTDIKLFFEPGKWPLKREIKDLEMTSGSENLGTDGWLQKSFGKGQFFWTPLSCGENNIAGRLHKKMCILNKEPRQIKAPAGWHFRFFRQNNKRCIHFLSGNIKAVMDKTLSDKMYKKPVIKSLLYKVPSAPVEIKTSAASIRIYSPDLKMPQVIRAKNNKVIIPLKKIKRYFIVEM